MNKLSILIVFSLIAIAASEFEYDFTIGLSDQYFSSFNATVVLYVNNSRKPSDTASYKWRSNLVPNSNQTINAIDVVDYRIEEFTKFQIKFIPVRQDLSGQAIKLRDFYLVPKYLEDSTEIDKQTIRVCPFQKHQSVSADIKVELKKSYC